MCERNTTHLHLEGDCGSFHDAHNHNQPALFHNVPMPGLSHMHPSLLGTGLEGGRRDPRHGAEDILDDMANANASGREGEDRQNQTRRTCQEKKLREGEKEANIGV